MAVIASAVILTLIACEWAVGNTIWTWTNIICGPLAILCFARMVYEDRRAQHAGQRYSLRYGDCPTCWHGAEQPTPGTVFFVQADMQYQCRKCGRRWTRSAWRETGQNPNWKERELQQ